MPLRRLSRREYNNTVRDLLGVNTRPADQFPPGDDVRGDSGFVTPGGVSATNVSRYMEAAEALAAEVGNTIEQIVTCDVAKTGEPGCARLFIETLGRRAYRRPLQADDIANLQGLYTLARGELQLPHREALTYVLQGMLLSPYFLYHWPLGLGPAPRDGALLRLSPYEIASRLSYFLWGSMPDAALFAAADAGKLTTAAEIADHARRMLKDAKARDTVAFFQAQWLELERLSALERDGKTYPEFNDVLLESMRQEAVTFATHVIIEGDARLETLLTAPFSFVNEALARVYRVSGVTGTALVKRDLNPGERAGVLTQTAFLTAGATEYEAHPVKRGVHVVEKFLCEHVPPPPPDVAAEPPMFDPGSTTRQRFDALTSPAKCNACHKVINGVGYGFEAYDAIGRYNPMQAGRAVDDSGFVTLDGVPRTFKGATELAGLFARSDQVRRCLGTQWVRYALGRHETPEDAASLTAALDAFGRANYDVRELLVALVKTRAFTHRMPAAGEVQP